jgi:hypothetical protein
MTLALVEKALLTPIAALNTAGIPTAFENMTFEHPEKSKWMQVSFVPNDIVIANLGDEGNDFVDGFLQVSLNYPVGQGDSEARTDFESLRSYFYGGAGLSSGGQQVIIKSCSRNQGRIFENWYRIDVSIFWYAYIPR